MPNDDMRVVRAEAPGGPEVLTLSRIAVPEPGPGEVLLRVAFCSFNPMDVFGRRGALPWLDLPWPFTPGLEHSGIVEAVGPGGDSSLVGSRAIARNSFGGNADYSIVPVDRLAPIPDGLDWKTATVFGGMTFSAFHIIRTAARVEPGEWCVFHSAAGPVGIMLTQVAKDAGANVIGLVGGPNKTAFAKPFGADHLVDYRADDWAQEVLRLTADRGADLIVDGNQGDGAAKNYEAIAANGRIIYIGATAGALAADVPVGLLIGKSIFVGGFNLPALDAVYEGVRDNAEAIEKVRSGVWKVPVSETVELEDVPETHARFERRDLMGRVVIRVGGEM